MNTITNTPLSFLFVFYLCSSILSRLQGMDGEAASVVTKDARLASFDQYRTEWEAEMRSMEVANQSAADAEAGRMVSALCGETVPSKVSLVLDFIVSFCVLCV